MAIYTITLSSGTGAVTSIDTLYVKKDSTLAYDFAYDTYEKAEEGFLYRIKKITVPTNTSPVKVFAGYYDEYSNLRITEDGTICLRDAKYTSLPFVTSNGTWTASWTNICPTAKLSKNSGIGGTSEIYFNSADNKWYLDYPFSTPLDSSHPLTPPTRTQYAFLGCYSGNNTTSTKYINADGTPTAAFLALTPSADITIYAQWQQVSYKVTLSHSSGSPTTTVFYSKIGVTGTDRFYSDDLCTSGHVIHAITPPTRELYSWNGAFSTSTQSAENTYINSSGAFQTLLYNLSITANKTISYANYWTQISYKFTLSGSGWTFTPSAYYTHKTNGLVYADWFCETDPLDYVAIPVRDGYRFLGYKFSTTEVVGYTGLISDTLKNYKAAKTLTVQGRAKTRTITFNDNGGAGGPVKLYTDATDRIYFTTASETVTSIDIPSKSGYVFKGYFYSSTEVCDENGDLTYVEFSSDQTVTARWERGNSTIRVLRGSGTGGTSFFYFCGSDEKFYADSSYTTEITSVTLPTLDLHTTSGLYDENGNQRVDSSGTILSSFIPVGDIYPLTARYVRRCYRLTLNHDGGSSSTSSIYQSASTPAWYSDSSLTTEITTVPIPTKSGYVFGGYSYNGTPVVNSSGAILSAAVRNADYTATATWIPIVYKTKPTAISGLVYNGSSRVGVNYDQSLTYTGTILATNAGSYSATFSLPSDTSSAVYRWSDGTTGNVTVQWSISRLSVTDSSVTFDEIPNQVHTGYPICPTVTMRLGGESRTLNVDYTVTYANNTDVGTATATATGTGNFNGSKNIPFVIDYPPPTVVSIDKPTAVSGLTYTATVQTGATYDNRLTASGDLTATNAGTYTATFSLPTDTVAYAYQWSDGTTGSVSVEWSIAHRQVTDPSVYFASIPNQTYDGTAKRPAVSMTYAGASCTSGVDFTVAYSNNVNVGTATATVTGIGNFAGTNPLTFIIENPPIGTVSIPKPTAVSGLVYTGSQLVGTSYDSRLTASGTLSATNAGSYTAQFSLPPDTSSNHYQWQDGTTGSATVYWSISPRPVSDSSVTFANIPDQTYDGTDKTPSVSMSYSGSTRVQGTDYTVSYSNNVNVGTALATVAGIGNFSGTKSLTFQIVEPPVGTVYIPKPNAISGIVYNSSSQSGTSYDAQLTTAGTLYATDAGTYTAYFTLPNDTSTTIYKWTDSDTSRTATVNWSIAPRYVSDSSVTFASIPNQTYDGTPKTPPVSMSYAGSQRTQGIDYTVSYSNNTAIGTATATVSGAGNFGGTKALTFSIVSPGYKTVTFDACGGTASESSRTVMYGQQIGTLPTASRTGYTFDGWYTSISGGSRVYETDVVTEDATYYAHWTAIQYTISYVLNGGTNNPNNPSSYTAEDTINLLQPTREGYAFDGWSPNNGVITIGSTGNKTFTASWTTTATYTVTFHSHGGYCPESTRAVIQGRSVGTLPTATYAGYTFSGWWTNASGGTQVTSSYVPTSNVTIHAHWTPLTYTLTFNANGGSVSPSSKTVTMGSQIGTLPTPTMAGRTFVEWRINGIGITSTTVWSIPSNTTAVAKWNGDFGDVVDYFGLGNANLIPESSDSGESKPHVVAYNSQSETPATDDGPSWRNPTVTYRVVGSMTLNVTLGSAFKAIPDYAKPTQTGYMITSVSISTSIGEPPTVTVKAVANEGFTQRQSGSTIYYDATPTPAIKTYSVSIPVSPRHRPQNLLSAISGGGQLQQLTLTATCDPVVLSEDNMPCASDVCHGRIEVSAVTAAYNNETAPSASNNFTSTGATVQMSGVGYKTWAINARKELT